MKKKIVSALLCVAMAASLVVGPFMFAGEKDGKLWFCTNNQKDVYQDMQANP